MKWFEIRIKTTEEAYDAISEMLMSMGAGGVAIEDPNDIRREVAKPNTLDYADQEFLDSLGEDVFVKAYFKYEVNLSELETLIREKLSFISNFLDIGEGYTGYYEIDEEDWATSWKKYYKPLHITDKVVIKPSWEDYSKAPEEIVIELDPGMAFGTGTHETTKMCAELIERYVKKGDSAIDIGCGTGILSVIAAKLGAKEITAVDIDELAVKITKENCIINGVDNIVKAYTGSLREIDPVKTDIVFANIIANVIIDLADTLRYYLKKDGYFITSGIIKERKQEVIETYLGKGFSQEVILEMGEWVAIVFKCQDSL
jgi:ribosomal protein L11 methyltransferase